MAPAPPGSRRQLNPVNPMTRKFLTRLVIAALASTAVLGIISVLRASLDATGAKILGSTIAIDLAAVLVLCCTRTARSALHRAIQATGIISASLGLVTGIYVIWQAPTTGGLAEGIARAAAMLLILAVASSHATLVLSWHTPGRPTRAVTAGTLACDAVAAELIANYAVVPGFDPGSGYDKALAVALILDALGTILALVLRRSRHERVSKTRELE